MRFGSSPNGVSRFRFAYWQNLRSFRRTRFNVRVGTPFHLDTDNHRLDHDVRQQMTDEIMYQLAALLPPEYRGVYSDLENATEEYLRFEPGTVSSLQRARKPPLENA